MGIIVPSYGFTSLINTLSTEYFGATLVVLAMLLFGCGFLLWKNQEKGGNGKGIFLYLMMLFLMSLLFAVVSIRDEQNEYPSVSVSPSVDYDYVINGNRIDVYERFRN